MNLLTVALWSLFILSISYCSFAYGKHVADQYHKQIESLCEENGKLNCSATASPFSTTNTIMLPNVDQNNQVSSGTSPYLSGDFVQRFEETGRATVQFRNPRTKN